MCARVQGILDCRLQIFLKELNIARIIHESATPTVDINVLPGVLGCSFDYAQDRLILRRTVQVRLGFKPLRLPGGTHI